MLIEYITLNVQPDTNWEIQDMRPEISESTTSINGPRNGFDRIDD